ncbi:MAG: FliO/MopB family protein [Acidobacteria bacterium]|nr:FliO/MopB family protein [Acidobacteriota bacterium]
MAQLAAVAAVFALLGAAVWWLRRAGTLGSWSARPSAGRPLAERVGRVPLGPHQRLELVRLAGRVLVIAVHGSGCSLLDTVSWSEVAPAPGREAVR